jgi:LmbE family N-acetylglucosaminyl deacetylase
MGPRADSSAVVFAPHQDDETLGCGGTIILKRQAGTPVTVVFMTDGSTSHRRFIQADELIRLRKQEAFDAAVILGVAVDDVRFLDFPDSRLGRFHAAAVAKVSALLERQLPHEVFVPYRADATPDHESTYKIVLEAVQASGRALRIYEYPVWIWNQWPWVSLKLTCNRDFVSVIRRHSRARFGRKLLKEFKSGVFVGDVLETKRRALAQHRSQMTILKPGVDWPTLGGVSDGDFLNCFFQEYEIFHCEETVSGNARKQRSETTPVVANS